MPPWIGSSSKTRHDVSVRSELLAAAREAGVNFPLRSNEP